MTSYSDVLYGVHVISSMSGIFVYLFILRCTLANFWLKATVHECMYPRGVYLSILLICVWICISVWSLAEDPGHLRTRSFHNKQEVEESADVSRVGGSCSTHSLA